MAEPAEQQKKKEKHSEKDLEEIAWHVSSPYLGKQVERVQEGLKHAYLSAGMEVVGELSVKQKEARGFDPKDKILNHEKVLDEDGAGRLTDAIFFKAVEYHARRVKKENVQKGITAKSVEERHLDDFKELKKRFEKGDYKGIHEKAALLEELEMFRGIITQNYVGMEWKQVRDSIKNGYSEGHTHKFAEESANLFKARHQNRYLNLLKDRDSIVDNYLMRKDKRFNDKSLKTMDLRKLQGMVASVANLDYKHGENRDLFKEDIKNQYKSEFKATDKLADVIDIHRAEQEKKKKGYHPPGGQEEHYQQTGT